MPILPVLLRVFLILVVLLNGTASAYASTMMLLSARQSSVDTPSIDASEDRAFTSSCASQHGAMAMKPEAIKSEKPMGAPSSEDQLSTPDRCDPSQCKCPCMHACAALPVLAVKIFTPLGNDVGVRRLSLGHPSPALPHLIRPPIG